jgi:hypothetical protein
MAHRMAWFAEYGRWPEPCALHRCDNPPCCNPAHLFEGTRADNMRDMWSKGRGVKPPDNSGKGEAHCSVKLTDRAVRAIRHRAAQGERKTLLAEEFSVSVSNVYAIVSRRSWDHI